MSSLPRHRMAALGIDFYPIERMQLVRFNGARFEPFGKVLGD